MFNAARSPFVHKPKNESEAENMLFRMKDSMLFSGGMGVMSARSRYPDFFALHIIDMSNGRFLNGMSRRMDGFEVDCNVRISRLLEEPDFPGLIRLSITNGMPYSVARRASAGGTACPGGVVNDFAVALVALSSNAAVMHVEKDKMVEERMPFESLCRSVRFPEGKLFIKRILIPRDDKGPIASFFKSSGNPFFSPESSVALAGGYALPGSDGQITKAKLAVCYADKGCVLFRDTMQAMDVSGSQYLSSSGTKLIRNVFTEELEKAFGGDPRDRRAHLLFDDIIEGLQARVY